MRKEPRTYEEPKDLEMLNPIMLMTIGAIDSDFIKEYETKRLAEKKAREQIQKLIDKCMQNEMIREALLIDHDLAEAFINAEVVEMKKGK